MEVLRATHTVVDLGHDRWPNVQPGDPAMTDDDQDKEIPADARECRHEWVPTDLADYTRVCRHCGKLTAPGNWHE